MQTISIQQTYAGKHILLTGASGFLGKVWLTMLLDRIPNVGKVYVLLRKKGLSPASDRFEKMVNSSHCFGPLHERFGADLSEYVSRRVEVIDGDLSKENLGIEPDLLQRLQQELDLVINCAGLVDFSPDIRASLGSNVDGAVHAAELVESCEKAALLHISTCFVAGFRDGFVEESLAPNVAPTGEAFDVHAEYQSLMEQIAEIEATADTDAGETEVREAALTRIRDRGLDESNATLVRNMMHRERSKLLKQKMADLGQNRARELEFPNTYTMTKFMAEAMLAKRTSGLKWATFRPAVVESAVEYPFAGWNEGFNTCGPLVYLLSTWFRQLPAKGDYPFDVVPVDMVCNGMTIAGAGLMLGDDTRVYQCGTSDWNTFNFSRATDLTALAVRKHLRTNGETMAERVLLSRCDATTAPVEHLLSMSNVSTAAKGLGKWLRKLPGNVPQVIRDQAENAAKFADDAAKQADQIKDMLDLFQPFTHDNSFTFECQALKRIEPEEPEFRFEPEGINWREYWIDIHVPGLRRWSFPLMEGRQPESFKAEHTFTMNPPLQVAAPPVTQRAAGAGEGA